MQAAVPRTAERQSETRIILDVVREQLGARRSLGTKFVATESSSLSGFWAAGIVPDAM